MTLVSDDPDDPHDVLRPLEKFKKMLKYLTRSPHCWEYENPDLRRVDSFALLRC